MSVGAADTGSAHPHAEGESFLDRERGLGSWLSSRDHKRIGIMYLVAVLIAVLVGGIFALIIQTEKLTPGSTFLTADSFSRLFTLHGAMMIFLFVIPGLPAVLGNFVLPLMLGADNVASPGLNRFGFRLYLAGGLLFVLAILLGGADTGWSFPVFVLREADVAVMVILAALVLLAGSAICNSMNVMLTVHRKRPLEMGWFQMPLFAWTLYATALVQVLASPALIAAALLLLVERSAQLGGIDPVVADPQLLQRLFWFYAHPVLYTAILPAIGVVCETVATFGRRRIFGYRMVAMTSFAVAALSFVAWGQHLVANQPAIQSTVFSALGFGIVVPLTIVMCHLLMTLGSGFRLATPQLYAVFFVFFLLVGTLSGVFLNTLNIGVLLHDTTFVVAHLHYTLMGGVLIAFLAGLHYWWPKMFGRQYNEHWGRFGAVLIFVGFNLTFLVQFFMGAQGMPRRTFVFPDAFNSLNWLSSLGSYMMAIGFVIATWTLVHSLVRGPAAPANPWDGEGLEWQTASPPPVENFAATAGEDVA